MRRLAKNPAPLGLEQPLRRSAIKSIGLTCLSSGIFSLVSQKVEAQTVVAQRLVSIGGALTEIVYSLQGGASLVGVDTTSTFPETARRLPNVGYARALSLEGVLALAPTQIIATEDAGPPVVMRQLAAAGIPIAVLAANYRFDGLINRIKRVGEITDRTSQANTLIKSIQTDWANTRSQIEQRSQIPARVLFVMSRSPTQMMVAGKETSAQAIIELAGNVNAINGFSGYKPLTPEAIIAAQPDILLFTEQGSTSIGGLEGVIKIPGVSQTPAGRFRRLISFEAMYLLSFGPRMPTAVAALHAEISKVMRT